MSIILVSQSTAQGPTIAIPGTSARGDLIVIAASRANATPAIVPAGWVAVSSVGQTGISLVVACRYAQSASEPNPSFTNAALLSCAVYRASSGLIKFSPGVSQTGATSPTINFAALQNYKTGVLANWYVAAVTQANAANSLETPPTGMQNRNFDSTTGLKAAMHDTNGNQLSNWANTNVGPLVNSASYRSAVIQIFEVEYTFPSGGAGGSYSPIDNILIG
jgi:hypothetical protein